MQVDLVIAIILAAALALIVGMVSRFLTISGLKKNAESKIGNAEAKAREIIDDAVKTAEDKKYVLMNAPKDKLEDIIAVLPGMKSPTVMPLAQDGWCSVHTVLDEKRFWEIIGKLKALGAEGILVLPIEKMII